jgi:diadenosine tetraphosphate (Ap4A) HIT family hydrolase
VALIADSVAAARAGTNPSVIARLPSGWAVIGDVQFLPGYCLLLGDPVVPSLNDLSCQARAQFLEDMVRIGDAILKSTDSFRINYEILGNSEPELHAHVIPRYASEPEERRLMPAWFYDWENAVRFSEQEHGHIVRAIRARLATES